VVVLVSTIVAVRAPSVILAVPDTACPSTLFPEKLSSAAETDDANETQPRKSAKETKPRRRGIDRQRSTQFVRQPSNQLCERIMMLELRVFPASLPTARRPPQAILILIIAAVSSIKLLSHYRRLKSSAKNAENKASIRHPVIHQSPVARGAVLLNRGLRNQNAPRSEPGH
jgi:hypothetical protein